MRHSDSLSSGLRYELRNLESFSGPATDSAQQSAWIRHELWSSLDTDLRLTRTSLTTAAGRTDHDQAMLRLDYRKNLPAGGTLRGRISAVREWRDNQRGDGQELVSRESHSVRFGVAARLERPRVAPGSVVVSDELGTTLYEEGVDYELQGVGEFTEVLPLPGGRIRDGQIVLVDYRVESPAMNRSTARRESFDFTVDYGWLAPFFGYQRSVEELVAGRPSTLFDDRRETYAGLRLRSDGPRLRFVSYNEVRSRDSRLMAFESLRLADGLSYNPAPHWTLTANVVHLETHFDLPVRDVRVDDGRLAVRWRPLPSLSLEAYGGTREVRDTLAADQTFDRLGLESRWNLGKISVIGSVERWHRRRDGQDLDGTRATVRISRRFFPGTVATKRRRPPPEPWPADLPGLAPSSEQAAWARPAPVESPPALFELAPETATASSPAAEDEKRKTTPPPAATTSPEAVEAPSAEREDAAPATVAESKTGELDADAPANLRDVAAMLAFYRRLHPREAACRGTVRRFDSALEANAARRDPYRQTPGPG